MPVKKRALNGFDYSDCVLPSTFDQHWFESNCEVPMSGSVQSQPAQSDVIQPKIVKSKPKASKPEESNREKPTSQPVQSKVFQPKIVQPRPKAKLVVPLSDRVLRKKKL